MTVSSLKYCSRKMYISCIGTWAAWSLNQSLWINISGQQRNAENVPQTQQRIEKMSRLTTVSDAEHQRLIRLNLNTPTSPASFAFAPVRRGGSTPSDLQVRVAKIFVWFESWWIIQGLVNNAKKRGRLETVPGKTARLGCLRAAATDTETRHVHCPVCFRAGNQATRAQLSSVFHSLSKIYCLHPVRAE